MAKSKHAPPPSRAELLADVAAVWVEHAPEPQLDGLRKDKAGNYIDHTRDTYAELFKISTVRATSKLAELVADEGALFERGKFRLKGERQARLVYWPKAAGRPG